MAFADWQCRLGGLDFGTGTPYRLSAFDAGKPQTRTQDTQLPGEDGQRNGVDHLSGTVVKVSIGIVAHDPETAMGLLADLRGVWNGDTLRSTPGAVTTLTYQRPGAFSRVVYGRPRRFDPATMSNVASGYIPIEADFQADDDLFYADTASSLTITGDPISYQGTAGTVPPHVPPVTLAEAILPSDVAVNAGTAATWPIITFHGPRARPSVEYVGTDRSLRLATVLDAGLSVTVDTRPWMRTVTRSDGASLAGYLRGSRLADMGLQPGDTQISFGGTDATLTSSVDINWRDAWTSL
ncbi:MAG: hypothetical protein ACRDO8_06535 [Nocardioidaceae bacterium]